MHVPKCMCSPLESSGHNLLDSDPGLRESVHIFGASASEGRLRRHAGTYATEHVRQALLGRDRPFTFTKIMSDSTIYATYP
jgi:hypothetical protein